MDKIQAWVDMGTKMGLQGTEIQEFVREQQNQDRESRAWEREERRLEEDRKLRAVEMEHLAVAKEKELELQHEINREAELAHKRQLELIQHQSEAHGRREETQPPRDGVGKYNPKLPPYDEAKDDIDSYLRRFETFVHSQGWKEEKWAVALSTLLRGKALDVFTRLSPDQALIYRNLKDALLKRFDYTEDGFRTKFRHSKVDQSETFTQYAMRLENYFTRWLELAKCPKTFDGLKDVCIREQLVFRCNAELALFLKERTPSTVEELTTFADQFIEARHQPASRFMQKPGSGSGMSNPNSQQQSGGGGSKVVGNNTRVKNGPDVRPNTYSRRCYVCNSPSHLASKCPQGTKSKQAAGVVKDGQGNSDVVDPTQGKGDKQVVMSEDGVVDIGDRMPVQMGQIGDAQVSVLRDTGCDGVIVRRSLVMDNQMLGYTETCRLVDSRKLALPVAEVCIVSPYYTGTTKVLCMDTPLYDVIIGNICDARDPRDPREPTDLSAVQTRAQLIREGMTSKPLKVPEALKDVAERAEMLKAQKEDETLSSLWELAKKGVVKKSAKDILTSFVVRSGMLYRKGEDDGSIRHQFVVPKPYRETVLRIAHESIMAGHMGIARTTERVWSEFFWPGGKADISRYCKSCDICQRTVQKGRTVKAPLGNMPLIGQPFDRVAVDIIGPLIPSSERGHRYIVTLVDFATRYPEAIALKRIDTEAVAEALVEIFSRVGVPKEILSDRGSQFTSEMMAEVSRLLSLRQLVTTPYHPACNGLVERYNGTLKTMLKRMCAERPRDWDRYLSPLLFAYREVPQESTGFAPFDLLFGRTIRGPMKVLRELWTKEVEDTETKTTYQYVLDLSERIEETCKMAQENLCKAKAMQKKYYDRNAKPKMLKEGDKVLVLLPTKHNKLQLQWKGPYSITKVKNLDYQVDMAGKLKTLHANMLRKYTVREEEVSKDGNIQRGVLACVCMSVIEETFEESRDGHMDRTDSNPLTLPHMESTESIEDCHISDALDGNQKQDMYQLLEEFKDVMTDLPGCTPLIEHEIRTTTEQPVRVKQYPLPYQMTETVKEEVKKMLDMGVIEKSDSDYSSPVVLVRKKDGTCRFCLDFRQLNKVTLFDSEPMPYVEDLFVKVGHCKYFTKLDLSKGYWQVPMTDNAKRKSAFSTPMGLFQFKVMSFGLVNAPATFSRLMRKVLENMDNMDNFLDDILVFTETWEEQLATVHKLLSRLRECKLTARPTKCYFGYERLECLGHMIGKGILQPVLDKLDAIREAPRPTTKKQVRSFMGLSGYYRKFIPNFATIAVPLTDLTKKGMPNKVVWESAQENAFNTLKVLLTKEPILCLPDLQKEFTLRTDASDTGVGAVLLQEYDDKLHPVAYASRKLLPRERRYAVMEKECLALVWGIEKFQRYLIGKEFCMETDHQPLTCLGNKKVANARIMRWALLLQPYRMRIKAIPGRDNVGADYLSRALDT